MPGVFSEPIVFLLAGVFLVIVSLVTTLKMKDVETRIEWKIGRVCALVLGLLLAVIAGAYFVATKITPPVSGLPVGTVIAWPGDLTDGNLPPDWRKCNGDPLPIVDFEELYGVIGAKYGKNDNGTFKLPNYQGLFLRCVDESRDPSDPFRDPEKASRTTLSGTGNVVGSLQKWSIGSHVHATPLKSNPECHEKKSEVVSYHYFQGNREPIDNKAEDNKIKTLDVESVDGVTVERAFETRPSNVYVYYLIKVK